MEVIGVNAPSNEITPEATGAEAFEKAKSPLEKHLQDSGSTDSLYKLQTVPLEAPSPKKEETEGIAIGAGPTVQKIQDQAIRNYLADQGLDQETIAAKHESSKYISEMMGLSMDQVLKDYDIIVEKLTGKAQDPKKFWENIGDQLADAKLDAEINDRYNRIRLNPGAEANESFMNEITALKGQYSARDEFKHGLLHDMGGGTARIVPHMIEVGKWAIPGAALMFLTKGGVGKSQLMTGLYIAGKYTAAAGRIKSFTEGYDYAAGAIFQDLSDMVDDKGNHIDEGVARTISGTLAVPYAALESAQAVLALTGASPLTGMLKKMGEKKANELLNKVAIRSIYSLGLQGAYRHGAKVFTRTAAPAVLSAAVNYGEEVFEEWAQLQVEMAAEEWAKVLTNELRGSEFAPMESDEYWERNTEEIKMAAKSMFLLQVPGMVKTGISNQIKYNNIAERSQANQELSESDAILEFAGNANTEEFGVILDEFEAAEDKKSLEKVSTTITPPPEEGGESIASISSKDGSQQGEVKFVEEAGINPETKKPDTVIRITGFNLANQTNVKGLENALDQIKKENPGARVVFDKTTKTAEAMELAIENQNPSVKALNDSIQGYEDQIKADEKTIENSERTLAFYETRLAGMKERLENSDKEDNKDLQDEIDSSTTDIDMMYDALDEAKANLKINRTAVENARDLKTKYLAKPEKPVHEMGVDEYRAEASPEDNQEFLNTAAGQEFRTKVRKAFYGEMMRDEDIDATVEFVELRANAAGMSPGEYISKTFTEEMFRSKGVKTLLKNAKAKAGIEFDKDGRVTIITGPDSDFSSVVHELGHAFVFQLPKKEMTAAKKWTGDTAKRVLYGKMLARKKTATIHKKADLSDLEAEVAKIEAGEWTTTMHEAFATGFEMFLYKGKAEIESMKNIFLRFADFIRRVFRASDSILKSAIKMDPEIVKVYNTLLSDKRIDQIRKGKAKPVTWAESRTGFLAQPDNLTEELDGLDHYLEYQEDHINTLKDKVTHLSGKSKELLEWAIPYEVRKTEALKKMVEGIKKGVRAFHDPADQEARMVVLHPSSRPDVNWQLSLFDKYGPWGHYNAFTIADALSLLRAENFILENEEGPHPSNPLFTPKDVMFQPMDDQISEIDEILVEEEKYFKERQAYVNEMISESPRFSKMLTKNLKFEEKTHKDIMAFASGIKKGVRAFHEEASDKANTMFLHPSSRAPGKWQLSFFDDRGPYTHIEADNLAGIVKEMARSQYVRRIQEGPHPESMLAGPKKVMFQPAGDINSEEFQAFFDGSKVVDTNNEPIVMHHGTTHKFDAFDKSRINLENDMGKGFYFSNTLADVESNYEGVGPDLTARIEVLAEKLLEDMTQDPEEYGFSPDAEITMDEAKAKATEQLAGDSPRIINAYLSIKNPVVVGESVTGLNTKETFFEFDQEVDEDGDPTEEPSGTLVDFADALRESSRDYEEVDIEQSIQELYEDADYEIISAAQAIRLLKQSEGLQYAVDYDLDGMASSEIIRNAFEIMGYDGVIDFTVNQKFGSQKRIGASMAGMDEDTFHAIAFSPTQAKSVENQGSWSPADDRIMFQPGDKKYIEEVKEAVEKGYDVPKAVLLQFPEEAWASRELEKRREVEEIVWLAEDAKVAESFEAFKAELQKGEKNIPAGVDEWLEDFYRRATTERKNIDVNVGHKEWLDSLTDEEIVRIASAIGDDMVKAKEAGYAVSVIAMATRLQNKGDWDEQSIRVIRKTFQNNPAKYRLLTAELTGDTRLEEKTRREMELSKTFGVKDESLRDPKISDRMAIVNELEDVRLKELVRQGNLSTHETERLFNEAEDQLRKDDEEVEALVKKAKTDKSEAVKIAVKKAIEKRRAHEKEMKAKRKLKEHARDIGKYIKRKIPTTVALEQRQQIQAIKDLIDPNFRRKTSAQLKKELLAGELAPTKEFLDRIAKRSLGEIPIEELMDIKDMIKALIEFGRAMEKIRLSKEAEIVRRQIASVRQSILQGKELPEPGVITKPGMGKGESAMKLFLATIRPGRIADMIDGGQDNNGAAHRVFIDEVNNAYNQELLQKQRRMAKIASLMKKYGINRKVLETTVVVDGEKFTVDAMMDVYAGMKNELKAEALEKGNHIDSALAQKVEAALTPEQMKLADAIIEEYAENYERLRDAFRMYTNKELGQEENYTPILRSSWAYSDSEVKITEELLRRKSLQKTGVAKNMVEERKRIVNELYQAPINLGLVSSWNSQVAMQEHYINMGRTITRANKVLNDASLKAAAVAMKKRPHLVQMQGYVDRVANPSIYKSLRNANGVVKELKNRSALAYLSFNTVTMLKQLPSIAFYMAYTSPTALLGALMELTLHPIKTIEFVQGKDPQMKERSIERYLEELKIGHNGKFQHMMDQVGLVGMKGIMMFDKIATTAGWLAVYNHNLQHGMSEQESIRQANMATLNTQPAANAKDIAAIYADDGLLSVFLQFTNQLNQIWNMVVWDAPQAVKNKHYMRATAMYAGMTLSAMAMWMLSNRRMPEEDEDWASIFTDQTLNTIPYIGRIMAGVMDGFDVSTPVLTPFVAIGKGMKLGEKAIFNPKDITREETNRTLKDMYEGLAVSTGLPYTAIKRILNATDSDAPFAEILIGGEWNDD